MVAAGAFRDTRPGLPRRLRRRAPGLLRGAGRRLQAWRTRADLPGDARPRAPLLVATASAAPDRRSAGRRGLGRRAGGERGRDRHRPVARRGRLATGGNRQALRYALANAAIIALYTVIDGLGVRAAGNALASRRHAVSLRGLPISRWCCGGAVRRCRPRSPMRALAGRSRCWARRPSFGSLRHRAVGDDARRWPWSTA